MPGQGGSSPPAVRLPVRIAGTADVRCGRAVPTSEVARLATGSWDAEDVERRTGIRSRQWVSEDAMLTSLGAQALQDALDEAGLPATALGRIIFASSAGGDMLAPAAANLIARELGLTGTCDGFDLNNGCVGFLSALDVGGQTVVARRRPVGLVMVEPGSRYITPDDPRPYFVTGDGVAAVVLDAPRDGEGLLGLWLRNDGTTAGDVTIAHPGLTGKRETIRFHSSHAKILEIAGAAVRLSVDNVLAESGLHLADIDWMVPHQPNGPLLDAVVHAVGIDPGRVVRTVHDTGSVGAASIPIGFHRLMHSGDLRPGDRVLMVGVGAGLAYGAAVYQVGR